MPPDSALDSSTKSSQEDETSCSSSASSSSDEGQPAGNRSQQAKRSFQRRRVSFGKQPSYRAYDPNGAAAATPLLERKEDGSSSDKEPEPEAPASPKAPAEASGGWARGPNKKSRFRSIVKKVMATHTAVSDTVTINTVAGRARRRFMTRHANLGNAQEQSFLSDMLRALPLMLKSTGWMRDVRQVVEDCHVQESPMSIIEKVSEVIHSAKMVTSRWCWSHHLEPLRKQHKQLEEMHDKLKKQFTGLRSDYLREVVLLRDQARDRQDFEKGLPGAGDIVCFYDPTTSLTDAEMTYVSGVVSEKLRMILEQNPEVRGGLSSAQIQEMTVRGENSKSQLLQRMLERKERENEEMKRSLEELKTRDPFSDARAASMSAAQKVGVLESTIETLRCQLMEQEQGERERVHLREEAAELRHAYEQELEERMQAQRRASQLEDQLKDADVKKQAVEGELAEALSKLEAMAESMAALKDQVARQQKALKAATSRPSARDSLRHSRRLPSERLALPMGITNIDGEDRANLNLSSDCEQKDVHTPESGRDTERCFRSEASGSEAAVRLHPAPVREEPSMADGSQPASPSRHRRGQGARQVADCRLEETIEPRAAGRGNRGDGGHNAYHCDPHSEGLSRSEEDSESRDPDLVNAVVAAEERSMKLVQERDTLMVEIERLSKRCRQVEEQLEAKQASHAEHCMKAMAEETEHLCEISECVRMLAARYQGPSGELSAPSPAGDSTAATDPSCPVYREKQLDELRASVAELSLELNSLGGCGPMGEEEERRVEELRQAARQQEFQLFLAEVAFEVARWEAAAEGGAGSTKEREQSARAQLQKVTTHCNRLTEKLTQSACLTLHLTEAMTELRAQASSTAAVIKKSQALSADPSLQAQLDRLEEVGAFDVLEEAHRSIRDDGAGSDEHPSARAQGFTRRASRIQERISESLKSLLPMVRFAQGSPESSPTTTHEGLFLTGVRPPSTTPGQRPTPLQRPPGAAPLQRPPGARALQRPPSVPPLCTDGAEQSAESPEPLESVRRCERIGSDDISSASRQSSVPRKAPSRPASSRGHLPAERDGVALPSLGGAWSGDGVPRPRTTPTPKSVAKGLLRRGTLVQGAVGRIEIEEPRPSEDLQVRPLSALRSPQQSPSPGAGDDRAPRSPLRSAPPGADRMPQLEKGTRRFSASRLAR